MSSWEDLRADVEARAQLWHERPHQLHPGEAARFMLTALDEAYALGKSDALAPYGVSINDLGASEEQLEAAERAAQARTAIEEAFIEQEVQAIVDINQGEPAV